MTTSHYVERADEEAPQIAPNEKALAILREIARHQEGCRLTDGSQTEQIIREGRSGAMYGTVPDGFQKRN